MRRRELYVLDVGPVSRMRHVRHVMPLSHVRYVRFVRYVRGAVLIIVTFRNATPADSRTVA